MSLWLRWGYFRLGHCRETCMLGPDEQERASMEAFGEEFSRLRKQQVKSPWGRNKPGIFLSQKESSCGWGRVNEGEGGMRGLRITKDPILGSPVFRPWEQGSHTEFCDGGQWRFLSWGVKWSGLDFYKTTPLGAGVRGQEQKQRKPWAGFSRRLDPFITAHHQ